MTYLMLMLTTMLFITIVDCYFFDGSQGYFIIHGYLVNKLRYKMQLFYKIESVILLSY